LIRCDTDEVVRSLVVLALCLAAACGDNIRGEGDEDAGPVAHSVFVANQDALVSYDLGTGWLRPGRVEGLHYPNNMVALADGHILLSNPEENDAGEVVVVQASTMAEVTRTPSTMEESGCSYHPNQLYLTPDRRFALVLNDSCEGEGSSAGFIDVRSDSSSRFALVGEVPLGLYWHNAAFSRTQERVVITNGGDCNEVLAIYDYGDIDHIRKVAALPIEAVGFHNDPPADGTYDPTYCDNDGEGLGQIPGPGECATASNGRAYCTIGATGDVVSIDLDADDPSFDLVRIRGRWGLQMRLHPDGRHLYALHSYPYGGCTIGQLVVIDSQSDAVVAQLPLGYYGPGCTEDLTGTLFEDAQPTGLTFTLDGQTLYVNVGALVGDQELVLDVRDPAAPVQLGSLDVGLGRGPDVLSGDGRFLVHVEGVEEVGTLTLIDAPAHELLGVIRTEEEPRVAVTFGTEEGPSPQDGPFDP
jgi:hypothetical protein